MKKEKFTHNVSVNSNNKIKIVSGDLADQMRQTGIEVVGDMPWSTHFCQFYQTKQDLLDVLVPYFQKGLENREKCVWVTSEFLTESEAIAAMKRVVPGFSKYLKKGQIEIFPYTNWYLKEGKFDLNRVLNNWVKKHDESLAQGFEGLRVSGNPFWIDNKKDWDDFTQYEAQINEVIDDYKILVLCTYSMDKCRADEVIDVVTNHQFALIKRRGKWELIESATHKKTEEALRESEERYRGTLDNMMEGCQLVGFDWRYLYINQVAAEQGRNHKEEMIGKTMMEKYPGIEKTEMFRKLKQCMEKRVVRQIENKFSYPDGSEGWFSLRIQPVPEGIFILSIDITEQKKAIETSLAAKKEWEETFDKIPDLIAIIDKNHKIVRANKAMKDKLGVVGQKVMGLCCHQCVHGMNNPPWFCPHSMMLKDGKQHVAEIHEERLGGDYLVSATPLYDTKGEIIGSVHVARDITERKKKEDELYKLNSTLRALSNINQSMMHATDEDKYLQEVCEIIINDCGYTMVWIGYAENDKEKRVRPVVYSGFEKGYLETLKITWSDTDRGRGPTGTAVRTGKIAKCSNMLTDPKFSPWRSEALKRGYASSLSLPLNDGAKVFGVLTIYSKEPEGFCEKEIVLLSELAKDLSYGIVTIRIRQMQVAAEKKIQHLASFPELNPSPVFETDRYGKITFANKATYYALDKMNLTNKPEAFLPNDFDKIRKFFTKNVREQTFYREINVGNRIFAEEIYVSKKLQVVRVYARDITVRKRIEEENMALLEEIKEHTKRKDEFIAMLGHELRNPLAVLMASMQTQAEYFKKIDLEKIGNEFDTDLIKKIIIDSQGQIKNMSRLLSDLLDVSRISRGEIHLVKEKVDLVEVVKRAFKNLEKQIRLKKQQVHFVLSARKIFLRADKLRLEQIIINLLNNASKYTKLEGKIEVKIFVKNKQAVISVKDNGIGIPPDKLTEIFKPFYRLKDAKQKTQDGLGVGLMLAQKLVQLHQGKIEAKSKGVGMGSEFIVQLSVLKSDKEKSTKNFEPEVAASLKKNVAKKILVVDDNQKITDMFARLLSFYGHEIKVANTGKLALKMAMIFQPDIVMLDIGLPGMDGYEIAQKLRQQRKKMVIIAVSGYGQEEFIQKSREVGFDHYLLKPVDSLELRKIINES